MRKAIKSLKNFESPGIDGISAEMLQADGERNHSAVDVWTVCNHEVWDSGIVPKDWNAP